MTYTNFNFADKEWIQKTIAQNDKDGDGGISLEEFIEMNIRGKVNSH
jgi:Ca2+-binding EF-hand superfamily protein